nr:hypothetical protein [Tanacetum cinerariifolium]
MDPIFVREAMTDAGWIEAMQDELYQFKQLDVWVFVPFMDNIKPLTLMEAIGIFLAYVAHKSFIVYQIDVKTTFLHGSLNDEVYVCQPEGFINADHPSYVYKLKKAPGTKDMVYVDDIIFVSPNHRYLAFRRHLEEIHVTWAHLEKKRTRLRSNTKTLQDLKSQSMETASPFIHDAITLHLVTASQHLLTALARPDLTRI